MPLPFPTRRSSDRDIVWLAAAGTIEGDMLAGICAATEEGGCNLICETALGALDRVAAVVPASVNVQFLVDADPADRLVALAAARRTRDWTLNDVARGDAVERIDRLPDWVARISRLLAIGRASCRARECQYV